ncbi:MAG: ATP-binding cassette domain-containing protein, partial [Actinomycetota bacterium]
RALSAEPRIVLFDEANTAVDGAGDAALRQVFERMKGRATVVLMTSRPSMLGLAERTFKLQGGTLVDAKAAKAAAPKVEPVALAQVAALQSVTQAGPAQPERDDHAVQGLVSEVEAASDFGRCLMPLLKSLRWNGDLRHLSEALPHFDHRLDIVSFRNVLAYLGYGNEAVELQGKPVDPRALPCLFVDPSGQPMLLLAAEGGTVTVFDPAERVERQLPSARLFGTAYFFQLLDAAVLHPPQGQWFKQVLSRFHGLAWALLGQSLIINLLSLGVPLFTMSVYDKVIATGDLAMLVAFLCGVLIVIAGDEVLRELRARVSSYVGARISYIVATTVFERTLLLPLALTERASIGSQLARFKDLESFRDFFGGGIAAIVIDLPFVVLYLVVMVALGGSVALVPVVALAMFAIVVVAVMPVVRRRVAGSGRSVTRRQEFVIETLLKMRPIRYGGLEGTWQARFRDICAQAAMSGYESTTLTSVLASLSQAMVVLSGMATMIVGVHQVLVGNMTAGALIASMMVVWRILAPMQTGFSLVQRLEQTRSSIRQLEALASFRAEGEAAATGLSLRGAVSFSRVSLRYSHDADPALLGVTFDAQPGEVIAIVGPDGAGKSTVLKLIAGLYVPQAGNVLIDDLDIRQMDPVELRKCIGYAPQVPQLFFGTIAQNLRLAQPAAGDADLREALALAGVWDEVAALPRGIDTRVGDAATNRISTSLAQGISLARAYLKKSPILLLDEPVTGLDFEGDRCFREFVEAMRGRATIFMVTHRPSHLHLADQIIVLEKGAVRVSGPAADVRAKLA